jgi:hypothetical protein
MSSTKGVTQSGLGLRCIKQIDSGVTANNSLRQDLDMTL